VVGLDVVDDDVVDLLERHHVCAALEQLRHEGQLHRVDERDVIVAQDKVGVVAGAVRRLVAMEVPEVPVDCADPVDPVRYGN